MGNSHDRRILRRTKATLTHKVADDVSTERLDSREMARQAIDNKTLALGILWTTGISVILILISQTGTIPRWAIIILVTLGAMCLSIAIRMHGWATHSTKGILLYAAIWGSLGAVGWRVRPQAKIAVVEMAISPSGFPISIPAHSTISILRINPNRILDATGDYLLKADNTRGADVTWPSQKEIDSKKPNDYETVFRVQVTNHSPEALVTGKLLFHVSYNVGLSGGGCMPPKGPTNYQDDTILLPQLDPGKSFELYAVNESPMCAWFIPPGKVTVRMTSDEMERQVPLTFNADPLYSSGSPVFPPTKITWEALPPRPNSYQIMRQEF